MSLLLLPAARPLENPVNGEIVRVNDKGDTVFIGNYRKNRLHGEWSSWYPGRHRCDSGRLENSVADGVWKVWYPNGQPRYAVHFNARKLTSLKDELRKQPKSRYYVLSQLPPTEAAIHYDARRIFGLPAAASSSVILSQQISRKPYAPETLERLAQLNITEGEKQYHPPFTEGLLHGSYTAWNPDGSLKETGLYLNGLREGIWEIYKTGQVKGVGTYRHGKPFGEWRYYDASGKILYWKRFDARGQVAEEHRFQVQS